jgi:hypothetical protein
MYLVYQLLHALIEKLFRCIRQTCHQKDSEMILFAPAFTASLDFVLD